MLVGSHGFSSRSNRSTCLPGGPVRAKPLLIGHSACWADVPNGAEAGLEPATYKSQVRCPTNSVTRCGAVLF